MQTSLSELGENAILERLLHQLPVNEELLIGPGDDCAVVRGDEQWDVLLKTDVVVEGLHFLKETAPKRIGRKALARAVSDIAAMGGVPTHALVTLLAHRQRSVELLEGIYEGMNELARQYNISIAGGETSGLAQDGLIINIALYGKVERGKSILRSGGQVGDIICVSGRLGGSFESERHLDFEPRLQLARELMQSGHAPRAMMDLSDGLATDLPRMAKACACDYEIDLNALPCHESCNAEAAMCDGEDYELLMVFSPECWNVISTQSYCVPITRIGFLCKKASLKQQAKGWQHFA